MGAIHLFYLKIRASILYMMLFAGYTRANIYSFESLFLMDFVPPPEIKETFRLHNLMYTGYDLFDQ